MQKCYYQLLVQFCSSCDLLSKASSSVVVVASSVEIASTVVVSTTVEEGASSVVGVATAVVIGILFSFLVHACFF